MSGRASMIVRVTRDDGSVTYRGPMSSLTHAERERDAWISSGRAATIEPISSDTYQAWKRWVRTADLLGGAVFFPAEVSPMP